MTETVYEHLECPVTIPGNATELEFYLNPYHGFDDRTRILMDQK